MEENLYNVGDRLGAFVTTNEDGTKAVYTDDVLDENSTKVVPAKNHVVTNEEGFYVNNGKGTYNTLNKDGLWVGGTNDEEGLHVDDKGNIETTGNAEIDGAVTAGSVTTGNVQINTDRNNTITGLSNTEWKPAEAVANRAATEGQLSTIQESVDNLNNNAVLYDGTDKSSVTLGGTNSETPVKLKNVANGTEDTDAVNFSQLDATNTNVKNLTTTVAQNTTDITTNKTNISNLQSTVNAGWIATDGTNNISVKPGENTNKLIFTDDGNVNVTADSSSNTITVGLANTVTIGSSGGTNKPITIDGTTGEISGLTNKDWDTDKTSQDNYANSSKAATEAQLKHVYDAIDEAQGTTYTAGNKGISIADNKISAVADENKNMTVGDNGIALKDAINLTSVAASSAITVGNTGGTQVKIDGTNGTITGLSNTDWDGTPVSGQAATEDQLQKAIKGVEDSSYKGWKVSTKGGTGVDVSSSGTVDFSNTDNNIVIGQTGTNLTFNLANNLSGLTSITVKTDDTNNIVIGEGKITGLTGKVENGTDAANKQYVDDKISGIKVTGTEYSEGDGIDITPGADGAASTIAVGLAEENSNLDFDASGDLKLSDNIKVAGTLDVTGATTLTGALTAKGTATFNQGASMGGHKITNVLEGEANTDAVNKGQMDTADGTTLTSAKNYADELDKLNVKYNEAKTEVDIGSATFKTTGAISGASVTAAGGFAVNEYIKLTRDGLSFPTGTYVSNDGLNANSKVIKNVAVGKDPNDAVNVSQLEDYAPNELVGDGKYGSHNYLGTNNDGQINMDLTEAVTELDKAIGNNHYDGTNILKANETGQDYGDITDAVSKLDAAIGNLKVGNSLNPSYFINGYELNDVTSGFINLGEAIGPTKEVWKGTSFLKAQVSLAGATEALDKNLSLALQAVGVGTTTDDEGNTIASTTIDWNRDGQFNYISKDTGSVVSGMRLLDKAIKGIDDRVTAIEGGNDVGTQALTKAVKTFSAMSAPQISTLSALSNMDMSAVNALASISPNTLKTVSALSTENEPVSNADPATNDSPRLPEDPNTINGDHIVNGELSVKDDAIFDKNVSVGGDFSVTGKSTFNDDVSINGELNMNGNKITGVADGDVSADSTDAINGSQLYAVEQKVDNNSQAINAVGNQVNRLSNRIDKVGAGAAALAALHPLDFDPDDKLSFAAGYGNYAGENAVAVGAFYQPNEDTMFSIGGTFGNDENMVNAGVSFKLGQKSNVSRSRVSMAKELVALRDEVAQLKALMAHSGVLPQGKLDTSALFPDVPENHWAYEYVHELGKLGILEGTESGNYEGDRMMTRYEMAAIVYRAMQKGVNVDSRMLNEFAPELKLIRVDVVARDDNGNPTIERVRVNDTQQA
ncbi:MAG TPA: YadA-like family protein [Candidatus Megamonas gallistercoris]|nr:YadA-like family protein [Candidatus Megamonas gallistercoris]